MCYVVEMGQHRHLQLSDQERTALEQLLDGNEASVREKRRAQILLLSDRSQERRRTDQEVAEIVRCSHGTVGNVRRRYLDENMEAALYDKPRPGAKPKVTGDIEAKMVLLACSEPPAGHARWTLRLLASEMIRLEYVDYISHVTVGEVAKKTSLNLGE